MAYQTLDLGTSADDGTGDSLRVGGDKINDNFSELYTLLGNGSILTTGLSVSGATITLSEAVGTFTTLTPPSADGAALGSAALEWSDIYLYDSSVIYFGINSDITLTHVPDVGLRLKSVATADDKPIILTLQTGETDIAASDVLGKIEFQAPDEGTGTDAILVAAHIAAISEGDFSSSSNATKLSFATGVSEAASEKMSLSSAGNLVVSGTITGGGLLTTGGNIVIPNAGTIGSASDVDAIAIGSDGDVTLTQDLELQHDGAILSFGTNDDVTLTHVHDTGVLLNAAMVVQFRDSAINIGSPADGDLDINADDEIELNSTLIDINGNVEISGTATTTGVHTFTAVPVFPNNTIETADIQADAVTGAKIADDAINSEHYAADSIDAEHYAAGSVDTTALGADAVTGAKIADDAINSEHYTNGSIDTAHIAADQIVASLIADDAIDSEHYTDGSIDTAHIADNQVTLAKMAGGTDGNIISYDASGDPVAIATGSDGQVLTSAGAGAPPAFEAIPSQFPSGTDMVFHQTAAPTGWTKNTTAALNDGALRTTTGTVGTGGTVAFETAFASQAVGGTNGNTGATTLSTAQLPSHTHTAGAPNQTAGLQGGSQANVGASDGSSTTGATGGGGSHVHGGSTFSGTAIDLNVKFYDVIIAAKD